MGPRGDGEEVAAGQDLAAGEGQAQRAGRGQLFQHVQALGGGELRLILAHVVTHHAGQVAGVRQFPVDGERHMLVAQPGQQRLVGVRRRIPHATGIEALVGGGMGMVNGKARPPAIRQITWVYSKSVTDQPSGAP